MTFIFTEEGNLDTDTQREESHIGTEVEIRAIQLQAKECQGSPLTTRN